MNLKRIFALVCVALLSSCLLISCGAGGEAPVGGDAVVTDASADGDSTDEIVDNVDNDHVHSYSEKLLTEATCSTVGRKANTCSCGEVEEGSETIIPFTAHKANEATCSEASVCSECGKVLADSFEHIMIDTVVTEATCTENGLNRSQCYRCGIFEETVVTASHELDETKLVLGEGKLGSVCVKCGDIAGYTEKEVCINLEFEDPSEASAYPDFPLYYPAIEMDGGSSVAHPSKDVWMGYDVEKLRSFSKYAISFDFKLTADGLLDKGESLFTFIGGVTYKVQKPGTKTEWNWAVKYFESDGVVATVMKGFNDKNSYKVEKGVWYNFIGIVDNSTHELSVYINGVNIGKKTLHDYNDAGFGGAFCMRLYDAMPVNGTSDPMFDNFRISEIG